MCMHGLHAHDVHPLILSCAWHASLDHQSLSLKPDDTFTCEMLSEALKDILDAGDVTDVGSSMAMPGMSGMPGMPTSTGERSSSVGTPMAMDVL